MLIIEDEPLIAELIQATLEDAGAESFDIAATGDEAVRLALTRRPDVLTSDVKLLSGTGPKAVHMIHSRLGDISVIFITGTPDDCLPCDPPGVILTKPLTAGVLERAYYAVV